MRYSNEGNMYKDWIATVRVWAKKDELTGKIKFNKPVNNQIGGIV